MCRSTFDIGDLRFVLLPLLIITFSTRDLIPPHNAGARTLPCQIPCGFKSLHFYLYRGTVPLEINSSSFSTIL